MSQVVFSIQQSDNNVLTPIVCGNTYNVNVNDYVVLTATASGGNSSGISYNWVRNGVSVSQTQIEVPDTSVAITYNYSVTAFTNDGAFTTAPCTFTIIVGSSNVINLSISVTANGSTNTYNCGSTVSLPQTTQNVLLTANPTGGTGTAYNYTWSIGGIPVGSNQTYPVSTATVGSTTYTVNVSNAGSTNNATCNIIITITQLTPLSVSINVVNNNATASPTSLSCGQTYGILAGTQTTLNAIVSGGDGSGYGYTWSVNGTIVSGQTTSSYTLTNSQINTADVDTVYKVTVNNNDMLGTPIPCGITIHINELPITVTIAASVTTGSNPPVNSTIICNSTPLSVLQGDVVYVTANAVNGSGQYVYTWYDPNNNVVGTTQTIMLPTNVIHTNNSYFYYVSVMNSNGTGTSVSCSFKYNVNPTTSTLNITLTGSVTGGTLSNPISCMSVSTVTQGANVLLTVTSVSGGSGTYNYVWTFSSNNTPLSTTSSYTIVGINSATAGQYNVKVTDANNPFLSANCYTTLNLSVNTLSLALTGVANSGSILTGTPNCGNTITVTNNANLTLTATANGGVPPYAIYTWLLNNTLLQATSSNTYTTTITPTNAGTYSVTVTDSNIPPSTSSPPCTLIINPDVLSVNITASAPPGTISGTVACGATVAITYNTSVTFTANPIGGAGPYTYAWTFNSTPVSTQQVYTTNVTASGVYSVVITDVYNVSTAPCLLTITVNTLTANLTVAGPIISGTPSCGGAIVVAANAALTLQGSATGGSQPYTYAWSLNGNQVSILQNYPVTITASGSYSLVVTDANNVSTSPCTLNISLNTNNLSATISGLPTSGTIISGLVQCGNSIVTTPNTVIPITAIPSGGTSPYTYAWKFNSGPVLSTAQVYTITVTNTGVYNLVVTDATNATYTCALGVSAASAQFSLNLTGTVNTGSLISGTFACNTPPNVVVVSDGSNVTLTAVATGGTQPYNYLWFYGAVPVQTGGANYTTTITTATDGSYNVVVQDSSVPAQQRNCVIIVDTPAGTLTAQIQSSVNGGPTNTFPCGGTTQVGVNNPVLLTALPSGGTGSYTYQWSYNGLPIGGANSQSYQVTAAASPGANVSIPYNVHITSGSNSKECQITLAYISNPVNAVSVTITGSVNGTLNPAIICYGNITIQNGNPVVLTATGNGGSGNYNYQWYLNSIIIPGANGRTYAFNSVAGSYSIIINDNIDPTNTGACFLTINAQGGGTLTASFNYNNQPNQVPSGSTLTANVGEPIRLTAVVTNGVPPYYYVWTKNNDPTVLSTFANYSFIAQNAGYVTYTVVITDSVGNTVTSVVNFNIISAGPLHVEVEFIDNYNTRMVRCDGKIPFVKYSVLSAIVNGGIPPYYFRWVSPNDTTTHSKTNVTTPGRYTLEVNDRYNAEKCVIHVGDPPLPKPRPPCRQELKVVIPCPQERTELIINGKSVVNAETVCVTDSCVSVSGVVNKKCDGVKYILCINGTNVLIDDDVRFGPTNYAIREQCNKIKLIVFTKYQVIEEITCQVVNQCYTTKPCCRY